MPPEDTHALKDDENCPVLTEGKGHGYNAQRRQRAVAAALTTRATPLKAPHPSDTGRSDGHLIRRRTEWPQNRFVRDRGAWPARAGVLAVAPVRQWAARRRRNARAPSAVGGHRSSNGRQPTASRPY